MTEGQRHELHQFIEPSHEETKKNRILLGIFVAGVIGFIFLFIYGPPFKNSEAFKEVSFPPTAQELYKLSKVLVQYKDEHFVYSVVVFLYLYTLLQAFAIPGPIFLCILSPALFGAIPGYILCLVCSCFGASICFFMSYSLARSLVLRKFPDLFAKFHGMVNAHRHNLLWYMLFLRLTPLIPNWFVNLASPLVGMPYIYFLGATFFGLMPNNFILIQTGLTLKQIDKIGLSPKNFVTLLFLGFLALVPTFVTKYMKKREEFEGVNAQQQ